ncbi:hypothetical protein J3Q64DRAFT_1774901 [Phycomyces blakesleeanus]|uniref:Uncharacterized protein n=2 Tax=Phycomyces blakesleeanus TaxID=4837 RepID=A0A167JP03_PHYB8|nr:hypothetical protein PHYBLDRAFT_152479 [Phycomyces blakesleeanus NRRL 1555(-)]OAD66407.1 hypothetical protein PHYBLDRAFT_152479 [Phycomyces blakesleeanus NRRL 1555(-)]|eukprot:XP_018284447.1 hypothetical protein PHYBLDRAFT_152479 [Phycomyces blakesleeanus NRRL 1555(-)]
MSVTTVDYSSRFKALVKPARFWRSNKTTPVIEKTIDSDTTKDVSLPAILLAAGPAPAPAPVPEESQEKPKLIFRTPSFLLSKSSENLPTPRSSFETIALRETAKDEIYELSTVNDSGLYLPPSPCEETKRDHWVGIDQEAMIFRLPSPAHLTTQPGQKHCFFTPSTTIAEQYTSFDLA